ncbi:MAG: single-stranded DNA-binding protein [Atopobiaceae bacterium]|nr:single-stranded DNA-binding protein [Atopobiaceae bacterium]
MSINRVTISGNLTRDPVLRVTQSGTQALNLGVAVNDRRRDASGQWSDYPNFVDCVMFGTRAASVSQFLHKGMKVAIDGKLSYSSWEKDGQKRSKLEVTINDIEFISPRGSQGYSQAPQTPPQQQMVPQAPPQQQMAPQAPPQAPQPPAQDYQPAPNQPADEYYTNDLPL